MLESNNFTNWLKQIDNQEIIIMDREITFLEGNIHLRLVNNLMPHSETHLDLWTTIQTFPVDLIQTIKDKTTVGMANRHLTHSI